MTLNFIFTGALPHIVRCLDEKRQNLKLFALITLDEMAKHNQAIAQIIANVPTLPRVIDFLSSDFTDVEVQVENLLHYNHNK